MGATRRSTRRDSRLRRVLRVARTTVLAIAFLLVAGAVLALVVLPKATGAVPLTVLSGSMEPTISAGDVVVVRPVDQDDLRIGDVVTYQIRSGDPTLVTHRIIGMTRGTDDLTFTLQGDDNSAPDPDPVRAVQIRGRVWYRVPFVGHFAHHLDGSERGLATKVIAVALLGAAAWMFAGAGIDRLRRRGTPDAGAAPVAGDDTPPMIATPDSPADVDDHVGASR